VTPIKMMGNRLSGSAFAQAQMGAGNMGEEW
jgi:hypothetical protein